MSLPENLPLFDKIAEHMLDVMYFDLFRYIVTASVMFAIIVIFKGWAERRRIQERRAKREDYLREISSSIRTVFFFGITTLSTLFLREAGIIRFHFDSFPIAIMLLQAVAMILAHDTYFYWMHRALHTRALYQATHLHHHKSRTPTPWTAYSFSVWEAIAEAAFVPLYLLATSLLGVAYIGMAILVFIWFQIIRNVMGHAGVEVMPAGWVDNKWVGWINTTTHHDLHHSTFNHNFGLYFTWWDRWMGTEHPQYKERFRAVAKPLVVSPRLAEKLSVVMMAGLASTVTLSGGLASMVA
ncbi:sterol desaturase family protein [Altererythrobacter arenosus]|uniref:Sterol desaturase family protein n=1 Tax=Altererythrobacter arenosus TaxID=3032592 RepID=A0ABY8FNM3_9SPHN|nr:sterol desaturase family protein [Altererythrobacter sp. CAU 1644]WFL76618.1 sterol desaturase family protein [Altererythrobacter sp. CAU 1644]